MTSFWYYNDVIITPCVQRGVTRDASRHECAIQHCHMRESARIVVTLYYRYWWTTASILATIKCKFKVVHKINDHVLCPIEFHGSPTWWKTGSPESFLGCPNYFGLSKKKTIVFLVMNTKLHRNVLLVQMRLSIMLNSSIHAIVRRLLKTWNRRARGLLNLGEGRARGIRRQN